MGQRLIGSQSYDCSAAPGRWCEEEEEEEEGFIYSAHLEATNARSESENACRVSLAPIEGVQQRD